MNYHDSGVDIEAGNQLVKNITAVAQATHRPEVLSSLGGFGALCAIPTKYKKPILVACTDGVGTKLRLACALNQHQQIGIDLVAMCVNDLIVQGAEPLFFLDYFATAKLNVAQAQQVIEGIGQGCQAAGAALIGGETAEMPGMMVPGEYELAGFSVGVVEQEKIIDGSQIKAGDALIALASSGVHSNGYALVRDILHKKNISLDQAFAGSTLGSALLTPTRIYVSSILSLCQQFQVRGMAHITGGGLLENIPRMLPTELSAIINRNSWQFPPIFQWIQQTGQIESQEMYRTFNCGVGMVLAVSAQAAADCLHSLQQMNEKAWLLGHISQSFGPDKDRVKITKQYTQAQ